MAKIKNLADDFDDAVQEVLKEYGLIGGVTDFECKINAEEGELNKMVLKLSVSKQNSEELEING